MGQGEQSNPDLMKGQLTVVVDSLFQRLFTEVFQNVSLLLENITSLSLDFRKMYSQFCVIYFTMQRQVFRFNTLLSMTTLDQHDLQTMLTVNCSNQLVSCEPFNILPIQ